MRSWLHHAKRFITGTTSPSSRSPTGRLVSPFPPVVVPSQNQCFLVVCVLPQSQLCGTSTGLYSVLWSNIDTSSHRQLMGDAFCRRPPTIAHCSRIADSWHCCKQILAWYANLSFGMLGGFTLASWGTLERSWGAQQRTL